MTMETAVLHSLLNEELLRDPLRRLEILAIENGSFAYEEIYMLLQRIEIAKGSRWRRIVYGLYTETDFKNRWQEFVFQLENIADALNGGTPLQAYCKDRELSFQDHCTMSHLHRQVELLLTFDRRDDNFRKALEEYCSSTVKQMRRYV